MVTCIPIARQRLGKHSPAKQTRSTIWRLLLGNGAVITPLQQYRLFSVRSVPRGYKRTQSEDATEYRTVVVAESGESSFETPARQDMSLGAEALNWVDNNGKKWIRLWKEDSMCDLKIQWDCDKTVARIRLVKTENRSACLTVNWKVCRIVNALYYL
jgi:hypothetical protein